MDELRRAKLEFFKRNSERYDDLIKKLNQYRDKNGSKFTDEEIENLVSEFIDPVVRIGHDSVAVMESFFFAIPRAHSIVDSTSKDDPEREKNILQTQAFDKSYLEELIKKAPEIIKDFMQGKTGQRVLLSIDLTKPLCMILEDLKEKIKVHQSGIPKTRFKWLPIKDDILNVWDTYLLAGRQSSSITFESIARQLGKPVSTVKNRWYRAYYLIYGRPYNPECKYSTEASRRRADELCRTCKAPKCYTNSRDNYIWVGCYEYVKISGKTRVIKSVEYEDEIETKKMESTSGDDIEY